MHIVRQSAVSTASNHCYKDLYSGRTAFRQCHQKQFFPLHSRETILLYPVGVMIKLLCFETICIVRLHFLSLRCPRLISFCSLKTSRVSPSSRGLGLLVCLCLVATLKILSILNKTHKRVPLINFEQMAALLFQLRTRQARECKERGKELVSCSFVHKIMIATQFKCGPDGPLQ